MPSIVPPGYTRGPILFLGPTSEAHELRPLLQRFWNEAGGYGGRILVIGAGGNHQQLASYSQTLTAMEADTVQSLIVATREDANAAPNLRQVDEATGLLLVAENGLQLAGLLGGTGLAQALRRANARGKTIGGVGRSGAVLCQHMIAYETRADHPHPFLHRGLIQFAPGLGLVNRLALDVEQNAGVDLHSGLARLLTAVAYNPFLIGVSLEADTGIVVYPDTTLEVFGRHNVLVVDGGPITHTSLHASDDTQPPSVLNTTVHVLAHGYTFNFDLRTAQPPPPSDIPSEGATDHVTF